MSDYTWPASMDVTTFEASLVPNVRQMWSPLAGTGQVADLLGERWSFKVGVPQSARLSSGAMEAFVNRLKGGAHRALLWHMARPAPVGSLRGAPTLNGAHAQGASSIVLASAYPGDGFNMLRFTQEFDNAWWGKTAGGLGTAPVVTANAGAAPDGTTTADRIVFALGGGTTANDRSEVQSNGTTATVVGQPYVFAIWLKSFTASSYQVRLDFGGVSGTSPLVTVTPTWQRFVTVLASAASTTARPFFRLRGTTGTSDSADVLAWGATFISGTADPGYVGFGSLLAGDMIGLNGMLLQAADDAVANSAGAMTVNLVGRLRKACTTGLAVTWDKPTAPCKLTETGGIPVRHSGRVVTDLQLEFLEDY